METSVVLCINRMTIFAAFTLGGFSVSLLDIKFRPFNYNLSQLFHWMRYSDD